MDFSPIAAVITGFEYQGCDIVFTAVGLAEIGRGVFKSRSFDAAHRGMGQQAIADFRPFTISFCCGEMGFSIIGSRVQQPFFLRGLSQGGYGLIIDPVGQGADFVSVVMGQVGADFFPGLAFVGGLQNIL